MESYINESFVLKFKTISGEEELNFTLYECKEGFWVFEKCTKLLDSINDAVIDPNTP